MSELKTALAAVAAVLAAASPASAARGADLPLGKMIDGLGALASKSAVAVSATRVSSPAAAPLFAAGLAVLGWRMGRRRRR